MSNDQFEKEVHAATMRLAYQAADKDLMRTYTACRVAEKVRQILGSIQDNLPPTLRAGFKNKVMLVHDEQLNKCYEAFMEANKAFYALGGRFVSPRSFREKMAEHDARIKKRIKSRKAAKAEVESNKVAV